MKKFLKVIYNIFRGITRTVFYLTIGMACRVIKAVSGERGKEGRITVRKARRIRALTKFKMFILNVFPISLNRFLGLDNYRDYLNEHIGNGVQLCIKRAD